jgi:hypothetical protein
MLVRLALALFAGALIAGGSGERSAEPLAAAPAGGPPSAYEAAVHLSGKIGSRPSASRGERRALSYVAAQFSDAGLQVSVDRFRVPGRGRSRNVVGALDTPAACLELLMAHADSVPPGLGANDNASGVGVLVALARRLAALKPDCDVWLVATGSEERVVIGTGYHVGAANLVKYVRNAGLSGRRSRARSSRPPIAPAWSSAGAGTPAKETQITASSSSPAFPAP